MAAQCVGLIAVTIRAIAISNQGVCQRSNPSHSTEMVNYHWEPVTGAVIMILILPRAREPCLYFGRCSCVAPFSLLRPTPSSDGVQGVQTQGPSRLQKGNEMYGISHGSFADENSLRVMDVQTCRSHVIMCTSRH